MRFRCSRFEVPEDKVSWDVDFSDYDPIEFFAVQPVPIPEDPDYRFVSFEIKINILCPTNTNKSILINNCGSSYVQT